MTEYVLKLKRIENDSLEITNNMQPCNRIYYSTVHWRLNMFRATYRSSSGALTVFAASDLHTHVVTGRSQVWVGTAERQFPLRIDYGRSPHAYVNQRLQIQLELLMMCGMPLETCRAFNERWNNKFYYKLHLVGYFYWVVLLCTDPWILNLKKQILNSSVIKIKPPVYRHIKNIFMVRSITALANASISTVSKTKANEMEE